MQNPIPPQTFFGHIAKLRSIWAEKYVEQFNSIILINGKANDDNEKTVAIVSWLLAGFNLTDTILAFSKDSLIIYTSQRKINFLSSLKQHPNFNKFNITLLAKQEDNFPAYQKIWDQIHPDNSNPKVGVLLKESKTGPVAEQFIKFLSNKSCEQVQASQFFADCTASKDADEIENMKNSGKVTSYFQQKFISEIETIIDNGKNVKHSDITKKINAIATAQPQLKKCAVKLSNHKLVKDFIDIGQGISLQSGGKYSSKLFEMPNDNFLKSDCIIAGMGTLYRSYNTYVARTLLIEPNQEQKQIYKTIEVLQKIIIQNLKPGVKISSIYKKAELYLKDKLSNIPVPKTFGFGIGIFLRQNDLVISQANDRTVSQGNCFLINCTFPEIKYQTKKNGTKIFAVQLIDTVVVGQKSQDVLTNDVSKNLNDISYSLGDEEQQSKPKKEHRERVSGNNQNGEVTTKRRRKQQATLQKFKLQKQRNEHQTSLKRVKLEELKTRLNQNFSGGFKKQKTIQCSKITCYKNKDQLPKEMKKDQIYVDNKNNAILFPINGKHIPFSVKILKSVVKNDQGKFASIRFNFHLPGALPTLVFPRINQTTIFVKEMTFRSQHTERINDLEKQVKALQRKVRMETDQKHAKQDIVEQEKISLNKGKRPMLRQLFARPGIGQKKVKGTLECHLNGFRYMTVKGQQIDIPFANIKHAFFQPCQKQIIAAIHFRLQEPMIIGKKKQDDIQFYSEGGPNAEDIGGRGRGGEDSDDQQRQKQARKMLDRQFGAFIKGCQQFSGKYLEFQIPKRNGGFSGTPFRTNSLLQPTKTCLINVTEYPFFVLTMTEVQVAFFERMYANIKSFDVTFVYKDYENHIRVSSIPISDVEKVKNWLDSCNVIFYDMGKNMNWSKFLAQIRGDFKKFVQDGAWTAWDSDDQQGDDQQLDGDSEFSAQSDELQEQESEESQESGSNFQDDDNDQSGSQDQELSEQGLSWDQLDERAEMQDRQRMKKDMEKKNEIVQKKKK